MTEWIFKLINLFFFGFTYYWIIRGYKQCKLLRSSIRKMKEIQEMHNDPKLEVNIELLEESYKTSRLLLILAIVIIVICTAIFLWGIPSFYATPIQ